MPGPAYTLNQAEPFKMSRAKLQDFLDCARCFILDRRYAITPASMPSFTINKAIDEYLKVEFDEHRATQTVHPAVASLGKEFVPFAHDKIDMWRKSQGNNAGVRVLHHASNIEFFGAIDDIWWLPNTGEIFLVDYKTTARDVALTELGEAEYQNAYRRQLDMYQWLLRHNGVPVEDRAYFFYATVIKKLPSFEMSLHLEPSLIEYEGSTEWVELKLLEVRAALDNPRLPEPSSSCENCKFVDAASSLE